MDNPRDSKRVKSAQKAVADVAIGLSQRRAGQSIDIERRFPGGHIKVFVGEVTVTVSKPRKKGGR